MNESEIKILNEIIDNMDKILIEKRYKYQNTWKIVSLPFLKHALSHRNLNYLLNSDSLTIDKQLRQLIHIFNYAFFLYYRLKQESNNNKQLSKKSFKEL